MAELVKDSRGRIPNFVLEKNQEQNYHIRHQASGLTVTFGKEKPSIKDCQRAVRELSLAIKPFAKRKAKQ